MSRFTGMPVTGKVVLTLSSGATEELVAMSHQTYRRVRLHCFIGGVFVGSVLELIVWWRSS